MQWEELVQHFYVQGMIGLGKLQNPLTQKTEVNLQLAKLSIEVLALLETKTEGNLSSSEKRILQDALNVLRVNYALVKERQAAEQSPGGESERGNATEDQGAQQ